MTSDSTPMHPETLTDLARAVAAGFPAAVADLSRLVRVPSVSWPSFDLSRVDESARAVAGLLDDLGVFDSVEILRARDVVGDEVGMPAVVASRPAGAGRPTVLLYAHHDVQPPGPESEWTSPAFEPTLRGDRLYGRGTADDKAGVMVHVAAVRALVEVLGDDAEVGITVFIEGEEEMGSPTFADFLRTHRQRLAADVIVVADSDNWTTHIPSLTVSLRGNVTFTLRVSTLAHPSHSGMYGGAVPDAMLALTRLLASFHADDGSVAVEGLLSTDLPVPEYSVERLRAEAGLLEGVDDVGSGSIPGRLWGSPAITVTGVDAPSVATASNTLSASASAKVSVRVAPGQSALDAARAMEEHVRRHTPFGAQVVVEDVESGDGFLVDTDGWAVTEALDAMRQAWGEEPVMAGVGGSIPFIAALASEFESAQVLVTGVEDPGTRAHSPDESLHLGVFRRAILTEAVLLASLCLHDR